MQYSLSTIRIDGAAVAVIEVSGRYHRLDAVAPELVTNVFARRACANSDANSAFSACEKAAKL